MTWSLIEVNKGDYLSDLAEEEDDLGVQVSVLGVQWLEVEVEAFQIRGGRCCPSFLQ